MSMLRNFVTLSRGQSGRILNLSIAAAVPSTREFGSKFEPPYLDEQTHDPRFEIVQMRIHGHDFAVVEKFSHLARRFAKHFDVPIKDFYPIPTRQTKMKTFDQADMGKEDAKVIDEFVMDSYERVIMFKEVPAASLPLYVDFLRNHQPEGVTFSTGNPDEELEKFRYIPDMEMAALQQRLDDINEGKVKL